jgi:NADP-dependent 3-hydroxy acid dehydrogenase YdfG
MGKKKMFKSKVVAITGAGSGIGRALALRFAREGAHLALSDVDPLGLQTTHEHLPAGCNVKCYTVNVTDQEAVFSHANDVERDFGTAHVVVNNAGSVLTGTVAQTSIEEYRWLLEINMYGVLYGTKAFLPVMLAQREGWVVNVSSVFGLIGYPAQSAYCM